ncbi:MAG: hypothetical protein IJM44_03680 [Ruminococcus sp.]|nr:hypothetical protein [Ruminococcus sp.]
MKNSDRLTYKTQGDATRSAHYCTGPGIKKDDVVQRLGEYEDTGLSPEEIKASVPAAEIFAAVFDWYDAVCKKTQDCDECLFHVPRKDCFTDGDIEQLIAIARKFDIAHKDGGADNDA